MCFKFKKALEIITEYKFVVDSKIKKKKCQIGLIFIYNDNLFLVIFLFFFFVF